MPNACRRRDLAAHAGPVWAAGKPKRITPERSPVWAERRTLRSISHAILWALAFVAFLTIVVWYVRHPLRNKAPEPLPDEVQQVLDELSHIGARHP